MVTAVLLAGCQDDGQQSDSRSLRDLYMVVGSHDYGDMTVSNVSSAPHRTLPYGYEVYENLSAQTATDNIRIRTFITRDANVMYQGDFLYDWRGTKHVWTGKVPIDEGEYYVYGFMPSSEISRVSIAPRASDNYETGAVMTVSNLTSVINFDPCVIVGIRGSSTGSIDINSDDMPMQNQLGQFDYATAHGDYIYVLIDHLFAALDIRMAVNTDYNKLRTIVLKKLELKVASELAQPVTLTATLTQGSLTPLSVETTRTGTAAAPEWTTVFSGSQELKDASQGADYELPLMAFVAPEVQLGEEDVVNKRFLMRATYDVYDRKGNMIRKDCTAENVLTLPDRLLNGNSTLAAGEKYTFYATVNPTFLYVLSEPDLDNPTIQVGN